MDALTANYLYMIEFGYLRCYENQPIRLPGLKPGVCAGLILSGAFYPDLKTGVWRRRTYQNSAALFLNLLQLRLDLLAQGFVFFQIFF